MEQTAYKIIQDFAEWSRKYPRHAIYGFNNNLMDDELIDLEVRAKKFTDKYKEILKEHNNINSNNINQAEIDTFCQILKAKVINGGIQEQKNVLLHIDYLKSNCIYLLDALNDLNDVHQTKCGEYEQKIVSLENELICKQCYNNKSVICDKCNTDMCVNASGHN